MSNRALTWAFEAAIDNVGAKFALVALADHASDHAGEDWSCFPSNERLQAFTSMPARTLERHLTFLWSQGWITRTVERDRRGRMRIRRYRLHRDEAVRDALRIERTGASETEDEAGPPANLADGHIAEPPEEPSVEPPQGADGRASAIDLRVVRAWDGYPLIGRNGCSSMRLFEAAFRAEVERGVDPERLERAVTAYGRDTSAWGVSGRPLSIHKLVAEGRYEGFLPAAGVVPAGRLVMFRGPDELRMSFVAAFGEAAAVSWLDRCGWVPETRTLVAANRIAVDWLGRTASGWLKSHRIAVMRAEVRVGEQG